MISIRVMFCHEILAILFQFPEELLLMLLRLYLHPPPAVGYSMISSCQSHNGDGIKYGQYAKVEKMLNYEKFIIKLLV